MYFENGQTLKMINKPLEDFEAWFLTGSQHLYGEETLNQVAANSQEIVNVFNNSALIPVML